jgi:hypothetical protein
VAIKGLPLTKYSHFEIKNGTGEWSPRCFLEGANLELI